MEWWATEETVLCGGAVAVLMLGVPLLHSVGECRRGRLVRVRLFRWWFLCGFIVMLSLMVAFVCGIAGFVLASLPPSTASRVSTDCKILSIGVDLRSTKICRAANEPKASNPSKFQCYFDYYWASVLKVEYMPRASSSSTSTIYAAAEVPSEALPLDCRPGFGAAWRAKEIYQVNETYPCKYSSRNFQKVSLAESIATSCSKEGSTNLQFLRQFWFLLIHSDNGIFSSTSASGSLFWKAVSCVVNGILYSMFVTGLTKICRHLHFQNLSKYDVTDFEVMYFEIRVQVVTLVTCLLFALTWMSQYYLTDNIPTELIQPTLPNNNFLDY